MHRLIAVILLVLTGAVLLSACGESGGDGSSGGGDGSTGSADGSSGNLGTGLELGDKVLRSSPVGATLEPWYVWNGDSCSFEEAAEHPSAYKADVREVTGGDSQIGYMHYGNSDPFGIANTKSIEEVADLADMSLNVYNLKFPSRTEPIAQAKNSVVKGDQGVLQANLDPSILPAFYKVLEGEGCIPSVQMYIPIDDGPAMGANWPEVGEEIGMFSAETATERGWKPEDTALVQCTDPDNGPEVNILFTEAQKALEAEFALPEENVFELVCKLTESQSGEKKVTDWFTSHPEFENVIITSIDSPRMQSILKAVERDGIERENVILANSGLDPEDQKSIRAGDQDLSVAFFPEKYGDWLVPMIQDLMAGNPVPKFVGTKLVRGTPETVDEIYPEE